MLVRLFPEQIADNWQHIVKPAIRNALPPTSPGGVDRMDRILESLMAERMHCWFAYDSEELVPVAVVTTVIQEDSCTDTKNLMVYSITSPDDIEIPMRVWESGFITLSKYAISIGCSGITGYTALPSIVTLVKRLGGKAEFVFVRIPLDGGKDDSLLS